MESEAAKMMGALRMMALTNWASKSGAAPTAQFPKALGVVMDWPLDEAIATVVAMHEGDASVYTTSSFGIIGGAGHEAVRSAATNLVLSAQNLYDRATGANLFPYPAKDRVRFYLIGYGEVRYLEANLSELENEEGDYLELWYGAQKVLTELRRTGPP